MSVSKIYLTEEEAAYRYGYSRCWFSQNRWKKTGPMFIKVNDGKILYPVESTDNWFKENSKINEEK